MRLRALTAPVFAGFTVAGVVNLAVAVHVDGVGLGAQAVELVALWVYSQAYRWAVAPRPLPVDRTERYVPTTPMLGRLLSDHEAETGPHIVGPWPYTRHGDGRVVCTHCQRIVLVDNPG